MGVFTSLTLATTMFPMLVELARESMGPPRPRHIDQFDLVAWTYAGGDEYLMREPDGTKWAWMGDRNIDEKMGDDIGVPKPVAVA